MDIGFWLFLWILVSQNLKRQRKFQRSTIKQKSSKRQFDWTFGNTSKLLINFRNLISGDKLIPEILWGNFLIFFFLWMIFFCLLKFHILVSDICKTVCLEIPKKVFQDFFLDIGFWIFSSVLSWNFFQVCLEFFWILVSHNLENDNKVSEIYRNQTKSSKHEVDWTFPKNSRHLWCLIYFGVAGIPTISKVLSLLFVMEWFSKFTKKCLNKKKSKKHPKWIRLIWHKKMPCPK